jgi:mRNA (guanine-N7-)-methyltransferase
MAASLPLGWRIVASSKPGGKSYFFHDATGVSSYEAPAPPGSAPRGPDAALAPGWSRHVSSSTGLPYFHHAASKQSRYDAPIAESSMPPPPPPSSAAAADSATARAVANAYDSLADRGREGRTSSSILHLKNFNNWVKAVLISSTAPRPCGRVLDLACGKLGDFQKWRLAGVHTYAGVDISRGAVEDAVARFNDGAAHTPGLCAKIVRADLGDVDLASAGVLQLGEQFDAISVQFALHYLFQTEVRALTFLRNIAGRLAPGGVFLGTLPDAGVLVRRLRNAQGGGPADVCRFGNSLFNVAFSPASAAASCAVGGHPYGLRYTFFLAESVESVDEYLVPWELLVRCAAAVGLVPIVGDNFHDFFARMTGGEGAPSGGPLQPTPTASAEYRSLLKKMGVLDVEGTLSGEEWEAAGVYRVFAFRAPMTGAVVGGELPTMATLHPEWPAGGAASGGGGRAKYARHLHVADIVDLLG